MTRQLILQRLIELHKQLIESLSRQVTLNQYRQARPTCVKLYQQALYESMWEHKLRTSIAGWEHTLASLPSGSHDLILTRSATSVGNLVTVT